LVITRSVLELAQGTRNASPRPSTLSDGVGRWATAAQTASSNSVQQLDSSSHESVVDGKSPPPDA